VIKRLSHLPVFVDPSHGTGNYWAVPALAQAATAVGADGLMIEVHINPQKALCDGPQALSPDDFQALMIKLEQFAALMGRSIKT
jgi:3-deoxy-7-phosphoheptulonate synthase